MLPPDLPGRAEVSLAACNIPALSMGYESLSLAKHT